MEICREGPEERRVGGEGEREGGGGGSRSVGTGTLTGWEFVQNLREKSAEIISMLCRTPVGTEQIRLHTGIRSRPRSVTPNPAA